MEPISFSEVAVLDANSEYRGVSTMQLMEEAGKGVADHILATGGKGRRVLILCGTGNNAGDGFVAARHLMKVAKVELLLVGTRERIRTELARANLRRAEEVGIAIGTLDDSLPERLADTDIVVDALLGVGIAGSPRDPYAAAVRAMNSCGKRVVSVDVPSGWGTELAVRPESTVTFHAPKEGMGAECGNVVVKPIGIPEEAERFAGPGELTLIPAVAKDAHKGSRGTVLVIGGGPFTGAPSLAAVAAHRCGMDLVYVAVPGAVAHVVSGYSMDLIVQAVGGTSATRFAPGHLDEALAWEGRADAVVLGPGVGDDPGTLEMAGQVFQRMASEGKPVVVDADALKAMGGMGEVPRHPGAVLTPHAGEFKALSGTPLPAELEARVDAVRSLAGQLGCTILSKGPVDVVSDGRRVKLNDTGNPAMATGGTGDILSGVTCALLAKGMGAFDAARTAAFVAGVAGDMAMEELGHSMLASDMLWNLPGVFSAHLPWWTDR